MKCIIYTREDGSMSVVHPVPSDRRWYKDGEQITAREYLIRGSPEGWTEELEHDWLVRVALRAIPPALAPFAHVVDSADLPQDRHFRDAWTQNGKEIMIPIAKAREVQRSRIRSARDGLLTKLDGLAARAQDMGDAAKLAEIRAEKQRLRDLPATLDAIDTLEGLKAVKAETDIT